MHGKEEDVAQMKKSLETQYEFLQIKEDKMTEEQLQSIYAEIDKIDNPDLQKALRSLF